MSVVGIFGGTFDPVHYGHLRPALELGERLSLSEVRMLPAAVPPHRGPPGASTGDRLQMLRLALEGVPGFSIDTRELEREGPSYMVDTLTSLREELGPQRPLCLLLGADAFLGLGGWHRWEDIIGLAHIAVAHRPGWTLESRAPGSPALDLLRRRRADGGALKAAPAGAVVTCPVTQLAISATAIREALAAGRSVRFLLPEPVRRYIEAERIYGAKCTDT